MTNKITATEELRKIGDAIEESILGASPEELGEAIAELGMDADTVVAEMDAMTDRAKSMGAKRRLEVAKQEVVAFRARSAGVSPENREAVRSTLGAMRAGYGANVSHMMMAARKGNGLSESDEQGILDDLAQLAALEAEDPQEEE